MSDGNTKYQVLRSEKNLLLIFSMRRINAEDIFRCLYVCFWNCWRVLNQLTNIWIESTHVIIRHLIVNLMFIFCMSRANLESLESLSGGASVSATAASGGTSGGGGSGAAGGQERVVRAFAELARNLQRMRPCVRPAMCKPYGKQSEQLQKS